MKKSYSIFLSTLFCFLFCSLSAQDAQLNAASRKVIIEAPAEPGTHLEVAYRPAGSFFPSYVQSGQQVDVGTTLIIDAYSDNPTKLPLVAVRVNGEEIEKFRNSITESEFALSGIQKEFQENERFEKQFEEYLEAQKSRNYIYLKEASARQLQQLGKKKEEIYQELVAARSAYTKKYTQRNFSVVEEDNKVYQELLESLSCDNLETYRQAANEQAKAAVEHFKDDFVFKIRSAIREAYQRRDELNRIISRLDFGKDKYQFVITKNKGADGKYYKMFMDDTLQINPAQLSGSIENQMNLFTMEHEENYGDMMNELIGIFIPPENATHEELEEAKKNMDKYADYRTYLSFDMQQIVQGEEDMKIGLGKMIRKNSGGEGQILFMLHFLQALHRFTGSIFPRKSTGIRHSDWSFWMRHFQKWMPRRWQAVLR